MNFFYRALRFVAFAALSMAAIRAADTPRTTIAKAILAEDAGQKRDLIASLIGQGDDAIAPLLEAWRKMLFLSTPLRTTRKFLSSSREKRMKPARRRPAHRYRRAAGGRRG